MSNVQTLRFRRPETTPKPVTPKPSRHTGILQDQLRRAARRPWTPSFSLAFRLMLLMRVTGAMYSNIDDCDEVFNFWEPLHFFSRGFGFQTWEVSPEYAIRSWAYIILHILPVRLATLLLGVDKRPVFFAVRIFLAILSVYSEARLYRAVFDRIHEKVGRYLFFMLIFSAGMWNASTAFLPSSFAMYASTLAFSYVMEPASTQNSRRTLLATVYFATGAIVGWPFAIALAIPFVFEELFVFGADRVPKELLWTWVYGRWRRLLVAGIAASLLLVPVVGIDSIAYGRLAIVPWNIIKYNVFGGSERGPDLYGTSPWNFYILNLVLNFNVLVPLALLSLPALAITYRFDRKRLGFYTPAADQSSPYTIIALRLSPFYIWLGILTAQAHKEERFMFPAYPLLCFNAAVTLYLIRGWQETIFIALTNSPYRASKSSIFRTFTSSVIVAFAVLSFARIMALWNYYHAPMSAVYALEFTEIPRILNDTGMVLLPPPGVNTEDLPRPDHSSIRDFGLRFCVGKEWYRFPGHFLVPDGIRVDFVKSEFNGLLPGHFGEGEQKHIIFEDKVESSLWPHEATKFVPAGLNDLNREEPSHYVPVESCDYLLDLDFPDHPIESALEPRYAVDEKWHRVACFPFLDARHSSVLTRTLWLPGQTWNQMNEYGDYCLLKNKALVDRKEKVMTKIFQDATGN